MFLVTCLASALSGLGSLLASKDELTIRSCLGAFLKSGAAGSAVGLLGFDYLGGSCQPWRVIGAGMVVGIGWVRKDELRKLLARMIG